MDYADQTTDEIRARLRAAAFPEGWLDQGSDNRAAAKQQAAALELVDEIERLRAQVSPLYDAVRYVLDRVQDNPDVRYYAGPGTVIFAHLCVAESAATEADLKGVIDRRSTRSRTTGSAHQRLLSFVSGSAMSEIEALGRRAVACKGWRWLPGMLAVWSDGGPPLRVVRAGTTDDPAWGVDDCASEANVSRDAVPDLADPATLGCLLALVREWPPSGHILWCDAEAEALVNALNAARWPTTKVPNPEQAEGRMERRDIKSLAAIPSACPQCRTRHPGYIRVERDDGTLTSGPEEYACKCGWIVDVDPQRAADVTSRRVTISHDGSSTTTSTVCEVADNSGWEIEPRASTHQVFDFWSAQIDGRANCPFEGTEAECEAWIVAHQVESVRPDRFVIQSIPESVATEDDVPF